MVKSNGFKQNRKCQETDDGCASKHCCFHNCSDSWHIGYPIRIKEAESSLSSAQARLAFAKSNLVRCKIRAPFNGRVKLVSLENALLEITNKSQKEKQS